MVEKLGIEARLEQLNFAVFADLKHGSKLSFVINALNFGSDFCKLLPNAKGKKLSFAGQNQVL